MRGMTSWSPELVSENEVAVIREIAINDLYLRLLDEESRGNLIIRRYEDTADYKSIVSEHIVDRLIRFDAVYTESERLALFEMHDIPYSRRVPHILCYRRSHTYLHQVYE